MLKNRLHSKVTCSSCPASHLCLAHSLTPEERAKLDSIITNIYSLDAHEFIYSQEQEMKNLYALYSGSCKEYSLNLEGDEMINNFYLPGDLLALESIALKKYSFTVETIQPSKVCVIPYEALLNLMKDYPQIQRRFIDITSYKMQNTHFIPTTTNAKSRTAAFLLNIYFRMQERRHTENHLHLPMSQCDISKFLGLASETLSRILHGFQDEKILELKNKEIYIIDIDAIIEIARCNDYVEQDTHTAIIKKPAMAA